MARAVDVSIVSIARLVFDVGCRDGDTSSLFLGCLVNLRVVDKLSTTTLGQDFCNGSC